MKNPPDRVLASAAITHLRAASSLLIQAHICGAMDNEHMTEIKLATQLFDVAERLEKDLKG